MPAEAVGAAIGAGFLLASKQAFGLFQYNQGIWQFDKQNRQNLIYQAQGMAVSQVELWREDLRDLFDLTNTKMDNYTTVSTLVVGFLLEMQINFVMDSTTPSWLFITGHIHTAAAFCYAILATVFSMYASIVVQQVCTKVMTHVVRLPLPDARQIEAASAHGRTYENVSNARTMLRVPIAGRLLPKTAKVESAVQNEVYAPHFEMFEQMEVAWMPLADYARNSMISCLTCMTYGIIYFTIALHMHTERHVWSTWAITVVLILVNVMLQKIDFVVSRTEWWLEIFLHIFTPLLALLTMTMHMLHHENWKIYAPPLIFFGHGVWMLELLTAASPGREKMNSKFRLTILQDMQFGRRMRAETGQPDDDGPKSAPLVPVQVPTNFDDGTSFTTQLASVVEDPSRIEVQRVHRDCAGLLRQIRGRGNVGHYDEEFQALSKWAGEPVEVSTRLQGAVPAANAFADPVVSKDIERELKEKLRTLRGLIPKLDDSKDRSSAPRRRMDWGAAGKRDSDDPDLEEELPMLLPNPINEDRFDEVINFHATQGLKVLPWEIFSGLTSIVFFCWFIAFVWSIINCVTPFDGPQWELTDYYRYWYVDNGVDQRTIPDSTRRLGADLPPVPTNTSSVDQVMDWMRVMGHGSVAEACQERGVDGATLWSLDKRALVELGMTSGVDRAKFFRWLRHGFAAPMLPTEVLPASGRRLQARHDVFGEGL